MRAFAMLVVGAALSIAFFNGSSPSARADLAAGSPASYQMAMLRR